MRKLTTEYASEGECEASGCTTCQHCTDMSAWTCDCEEYDVEAREETSWWFVAACSVGGGIFLILVCIVGVRVRKLTRLIRQVEAVEDAVGYDPGDKTRSKRGSIVHQVAHVTGVKKLKGLDDLKSNRDQAVQTMRRASLQQQEFPQEDPEALRVALQRIENLESQDRGKRLFKEYLKKKDKQNGLNGLTGLAHAPQEGKIKTVEADSTPTEEADAHLGQMSPRARAAMKGQRRKIRVLDLQLDIVEAKDLIASDQHVDRAASSDPYVKVLAGGKREVFRTSVQDNTLNPVWNASCKLKVCSDADLVLMISDHDDLSNDDTLGQVTLRPAEYFSVAYHWIPIKPGPGCPNPTGKIHLRARFKAEEQGEAPEEGWDGEVPEDLVESADAGGRRSSNVILDSSLSQGKLGSSKSKRKEGGGKRSPRSPRGAKAAGSGDEASPNSVDKETKRKARKEKFDAVKGKEDPEASPSQSDKRSPRGDSSPRGSKSKKKNGSVHSPRSPKADTKAGA